MSKEFAFGFIISAAITSSFMASFSKANKSTKELGENLIDLKRTKIELDKSFKAGTISIDSYNNAMSKINTQIDKQRMHFEKLVAMQEKVKSYRGLAASNFTKAFALAGVTKGMFNLADNAINFESSMADVKKVVDFDTPKQFNEMQQDILNLSKTIPITAEGFAQIIASGGQAGIAREDLVKFAEAAAKMGVAFDISADQAGDMMAKWRTAFKMNQDDVVELADKINYLGNTTSAKAPLISDVVTRIGPLGEVGGVASGEIAALGASLIGSGIQSEVAATGIKNLILTMTAGAGATKSQADAFSTLGLDAEYVAVKMQKDAKGAIIEVLGALRDLDKVQQATTLAKLFGKESLGAIAPLLSNLEVLSENFSKVADSSQYSSSMQKEFEEKANSTENKIRLMNQSIRAASITIGKNFIPILHPFITIVSDSAKVIGDFASEYPGLTKSMFGAAIGLGTFSAAVYACKGIYNVWKSVEAGYLMFKEMQIATKGAAMTQMFFNTTLAACPVTWLIAGISALVVSGYVLYKNWDQITDWLILLWNDPIKAIQKFTDILGTAVNWAKEKWENLKNMLSIPIFGNIKIATTEVKSSAIGVAQNSKGGIYSQGAFLTTFAENSPEAAIPIDGSQRAKNLWAQTGEMLGVGSVSPVQVTFSPKITIQGNASREDVNRAMDLTLDKLEELLIKLSHRQRRLSYG